MNLVFKPKPKPKNTMKIEFPDGSVKQYELISRTIEGQRKVIDVFKGFSKIRQDDPDASYKALDKALGVLLNGASLEEFKEFDTDDIIDLINTIKEKVLSSEDRDETEKKTVSNEAM